jgi:hypothetical protein
MRKNQPQNRETIALLDPNHENFNFELWAVAVRLQMLAVLRRK